MGLIRPKDHPHGMSEIQCGPFPATVGLPTTSSCTSADTDTGGPAPSQADFLRIPDLGEQLHGCFPDAALTVRSFLARPENRAPCRLPDSPSAIQCAPTMKLPSRHCRPQRRTEDFTWRRSAAAQFWWESSVSGSPPVRSPQLG
jgi:hypothetical protein